MFISVLNSDLPRNPWLAVQWNNDLDALLSDPTYNPAVTRNFPKKQADQPGQSITVTDSVSGDPQTATVVQLAESELSSARTLTRIKKAPSRTKPKSSKQ